MSEVRVHLFMRLKKTAPGDYLTLFTKDFVISRVRFLSLDPCRTIGISLGYREETYQLREDLTQSTFQFVQEKKSIGLRRRKHVI